MCLSVIGFVTLAVGVLLFQRISENTGFYKKLSDTMFRRL